MTRGENMLDIVYSMLGNIPAAVIAAILAGLLRNIAGWIENFYKDGIIDSYDIKQLFGTIIKYFVCIMLLMPGVPIGQAIAGSFVLDVGSSALKSRKA